MRFNYGLFTVICALTVSGCGDGRNEQAPQTSAVNEDQTRSRDEEMTVENYMPIEVGNWYSFRNLYEGYVDGSPMDDLLGYGASPVTSYFYYEYTDIVESTRHGTLCEVTYGIDGSEDTDHFYRRVAEGEFSALDGQNDQVVEILLQEPLEVGHSWITQSRSGDHISYTNTIVSINEDVSVPLGTFTCIHVTKTMTDDTIGEGWYYQENYGQYDYAGMETVVKDTWFAPGVGIVKWATVVTTNNEHPVIITDTFELVDRNRE